MKGFSASRSIWFSPILFLAAIVFICGCAGSGSKDTEDSSGGGKGDDKHKAALMPNAKAEEELLEKGIDAYDRELFTLAKENFTELQDKYPASYYSAFAELKIADCLFNLADYAAAVTAYQEFIKLHPKHEATAYAKFQIGESYNMQYRGSEHDQGPLRSAIKSYEVLIGENPRSEYVPRAKQQIKECRERLAEHEAEVARFYFKQGQVEASAGRYREISQKYADSSTAQLTTEQVREQFGDNPALLDFIGSGSAAVITKQMARLKTPEAAVPPAEKQAVTPGEENKPAEQAHQAAPVQKSDEIAKLSEEKNELPEDLPAENRSFLLGLTCKQLGNYAAFSARFRGPVQVASRSEEATAAAEQKEKKITAVFSSAGQDVSAEDTEGVALSYQPIQCSAAGMRIIVQEYFKRTEESVTPSSSVVKLFASIPISAKLDLLVLEQPYRVVGIIPLQTPQSSTGARSAQ